MHKYTLALEHVINNLKLGKRHQIDLHKPSLGFHKAEEI